MNATMKPGDQIEWTYKRNGQCVAKREMLWSSTMERYVPIGSGLIHVLVSIDSERITWMNEKRLFHARLGDTTAWSILQGHNAVVPRALG